MKKKYLMYLLTATLFVVAFMVSCNSSTTGANQQPSPVVETDVNDHKTEQSAFVNPITSEESFNQTIANKEKIVLVDFWASWCRPCVMMAPIVEAVAEEKSDKLGVFKVDMNQPFVEEGNLAELYGISAIPCFILFSNGKEVARNEGYMEKEEFDAWLKGYVK